MLRVFPARLAETRCEDTLLTGALPDQAAPHGALARIEAPGLELLQPGARPPRRVTGANHRNPVMPNHPAGREA